MPDRHPWLHCPPVHPQIEAIPALRDNYFWLIAGPDGRSAAVVDPGEAAPVQAALSAHGYALGAILLTHHHGDHVGGVAELARQWHCEVFGPAGEAIAGVTTAVAAGAIVAPAGLGTSFEVIDVPGHTRGHIAYFAERHGTDQRPVLFCGDTLFAGGCGRIFEGTPEQLLASLDRLAALPGQTLVYCAHEYTVSNLRFALAAEPGSAELVARNDEALRMQAAGIATVPSNIAIELATNPFLRCDQVSIRNTVATRIGKPPVSRIETFAQLRAWKNQFA